MEIIKELPDEIVLLRAMDPYAIHFGLYNVGFVSFDKRLANDTVVEAGEFNGRWYYPLTYVNHLDMVIYESIHTLDISTYSVVDIDLIDNEKIAQLRSLNNYTFIETATTTFVSNGLNNHKLTRSGNTVVRSPSKFHRYTSVEAIIESLKEYFNIKSIYRAYGKPVV